MTSVTGKVLWLRAKDLTGLSDGASMSTWPDSSGLARTPSRNDITYNTVYRASATPLGGPAVEFSGGGEGFNYASVATASSEWFSTEYPPRHAIDGLSTTYWHSGSTTMPQWFQVRLPDPTVVTGYTIGTFTDGGPEDFTFQGSNDGSSWTTLDTRTDEAWSSGQSRTFSFSNSTAYTYYRVHVTAVVAAASGYLRWHTLSLTGYDGFPFTDGELWVVVKSDNAAGQSGAWDFGASAQQSHYPYDGVVYDDAGSTTRASFTPTMSIGDWRVYRVRVSGTTRTFYLDGTSQASDTVTPTWATIPVVGAFTGSLQGRIAELILFDHALDSGDEAAVEAYLEAEHFTASTGVTGTLDVTDHADTATFSGTVTAAPVTGALSVTDHADDATLSGTVAGPITGALSVTDHADEASFTGNVSGVGGAVVGVLSVVDHADVATFEGQNLGEIDDIDVRPVRVSVAPRLHTVPVPAPIPASLASNVRPVVRVSHVAPAITAANAPLTEGVDYPLVSPVVVGWERFFVDDIDRTYWRDTPVIISRLSSSTPLGYSAASIEIPAMHPWEKPGEGELAWLRPDAPVKVALVDEFDEIIEVLWSGFISKDSADLGEGRKALGVTCDGITWQAGYAQHEPPHYMPPTDIGAVVPDLLNSVPGKRYGDIPRVVTGIPTRTRGSSAQKKAQVANEILQKEGWTLDGRQWTIEEVAPDEYRMVLKAPASTVHATVTYGAFGVDVNLERDQASRIDLIYGVGNAPNGGQWRGTRFPGLVIATPPPYPNSGGESIHVGDTDADTDSGTGVTVWQTRMVELGYSLNIDGTYSTLDAQALYRLQGRMGLLEDGVLGPQSWSGTFNRGPEGIDLTQWREPLAALSWTQEHYRDPNGIILAENPSYADTAKVQHQVEIHYGENITWTVAQPLAEKLLNVESTPALTGQIALTTDPHEGSRRHLKAGQNIKVVGFQGADVVLRIARVDLEADGRVILAVDERGRDALTVEQIRARDLAAMADPVRRPGNPNRESRIARDRYVQWDIDSPCGFMPRTAVFGGLWVCPNPIPFAEVGRVVKTMLRSTVPFSLALFGLPVKPSQLHAIVGNPLASTDPYRPHTEALDALGWIEAWGSQGDACGYSPGQESDGYAFTGEFVEIGGFDFISGRPPYVWPALYSATTGFIGGAEAGGWGRFYPDTAA